MWTLSFFHIWTPIMLHLNLVLIYCLLLFMNYYLISISLCLFFSFNSHNLGRLLAITDAFSTIPFHLVLFSLELVELAKSIPVHSLILAFHLFFSLHLLFPFIVLCRIVFAKPVDLQMWQNHLHVSFLTRVGSSSYSLMAAWILLQTSSLVTWSM